MSPISLSFTPGAMTGTSTTPSPASLQFSMAFSFRSLSFLPLRLKSVADGTSQVTACGELQEHTAALPQVLFAKPAVIGTTFRGLLPVNGRFDAPVLDLPVEIAPDIAFPDQSFERTVLGAAFQHIYIPVPVGVFFGRDHFEAYRAYAFCFCKYHCSDLFADDRFIGGFSARLKEAVRHRSSPYGFKIILAPKQSHILN